MADEKNHDWLIKLLRGLLFAVVILVALAVVGFGLIVGFCALGIK